MVIFTMNFVWCPRQLPSPTLKMFDYFLFPKLPADTVGIWIPNIKTLPNLPRVGNSETSVGSVESENQFKKTKFYCSIINRDV